MRKLKKYLLDSLKFFVCALFWLDFEDVELTFLGVLMSLFAPITIILICFINFIRYFIVGFKRLNFIERRTNNEI